MRHVYIQMAYIDRLKKEKAIYKVERGRRMQEEKQCEEDKQMWSTVWNGKYKFKLGVDEEGGRWKEEGGTERGCRNKMSNSQPPELNRIF